MSMHEYVPVSANACGDQRHATLGTGATDSWEPTDRDARHWVWVLCKNSITSSGTALSHRTGNHLNFTPYQMAWSSSTGCNLAPRKLKEEDLKFKVRQA